GFDGSIDLVATLRSVLAGPLETTFLFQSDEPGAVLFALLFIAEGNFADTIVFPGGLIDRCQPDPYAICSVTLQDSLNYARQFASLALTHVLKHVRVRHYADHVGYCVVAGLHRPLLCEQVARQLVAGL